jgi:hypothetical protein
MWNGIRIFILSHWRRPPSVFFHCTKPNAAPISIGIQTYQ